MNILVDLDGTLITCREKQLTVLQAALSIHDISIDLSLTWELKRAGSSTKQAMILQGLPEELVVRITNDWIRMIEDYIWLNLDRILPHVKPTLNEMYKTANLILLTSRRRPEFVKLQIRRLGLSIYFEEIIVVNVKNPEAEKAHWLRSYNASAYFGDTEIDAKAAELAKIPFFAVTTGQRNASFMIQSGIKNLHTNLADAWKSFRLYSAERDNHSRIV